MLNITVLAGGRGGADRLYANFKYYCQEGEEERTGSGLMLNITVRRERRRGQALTNVKY